MSLSSSPVKIISSGDLNKDNYLPYLRSIWSGLNINERINVFKAIIYLRSPRLGLGKEEKGVYALKALVVVDTPMVIKYLPLYLKYSSWKDLNYLLPTLVFGEIINLWAKQLIVDIVIGGCYMVHAIIHIVLLTHLL